MVGESQQLGVVRALINYISFRWDIFTLTHYITYMLKIDTGCMKTPGKNKRRKRTNDACAIIKSSERKFTKTATRSNFRPVRSFHMMNVELQNTLQYIADVISFSFLDGDVKMHTVFSSPCFNYSIPCFEDVSPKSVSWIGIKRIMTSIRAFQRT